MCPGDHLKVVRVTPSESEPDVFLVVLACPNCGRQYTGYLGAIPQMEVPQ